MTATFDTAREVQASLVERPVRMLVDGQLVGAAGSIDVIDPATGEVAAQAPAADEALLDRAIAAARRAQPGWAVVGIEERRQALFAMAAILRDNAPELAGLVTLEQGKPLAAARFEIERAAAMQEALASIALDDDILRDTPTGRVERRFRPLGVVGAITPWNQPVGLAVPGITHALYTGNTLVLKPSPYAPLAVMRIGELVRDVFPAGVLNILNGEDAIGRAITDHSGIDKIGFTGSVPTGQKVMASAAATLKRITLELGGNDAAIVLADADVDAVVPRLFAAAFVNCGQVCMSIKRLYVHDSLYDRVADGLARLARETTLGSGFDPATTMGPVQNAAQLAVVGDIIADSRQRGHILAGGTIRPGGGYFVEPTIVTRIGAGARLVDEEAFGPVLPVMRFTDVDEAVALANDSPYGLAGSVWGTDLDQAAAVARRIESGTVWINHHVGADPLVPFGGVKRSGVGRQFGLEGLREYMMETSLFLPAAAA